jgi:hypothetical protein
MCAGVDHWIGVAAFGLLLATVPAFAEEPKEAEAHERAPFCFALWSRQRPPRRRSLKFRVIGWALPERGSVCSFVELPPQGTQLGPPQRRHHAISFAPKSQRASALARSGGHSIAARGSLSQPAAPDEPGHQAEVQGQVQFGCSF